MGQGRESAKSYLRENSEVSEQIEHKVKVALGIVKPLKEVEAVNG